MWDILLGWIDSPADRAAAFTALFGILFGLLNWLRTDTPKSETDRRAVIASLRQDRLGARYKALLTRTLDALDAKLSAEERADGAAPRALATAWSFGLLNLSLSLALAYPILGLLLNWGLFNNGALGGDVVIPEAELLVRAATLCGLAVAIALKFYSLRLQGRAKLVLELVLLGLAVAVAVAGALVVAVAVAVAFAVEWIGARLNLRTISLTLWAMLGVAGVSLAARNGASAVDTKSLILFIAALPLLNALADFASTGLTRYLLRRSVDTSGRWEALGDLIGGAAIYLALGCAVIAFIAWTPLLDGTHLANLPQIFQDLADPATRGQYWWLLVMLASTLLPTALHLHLFLMTLIRHIPACLRHWLAYEFVIAARINSNFRGRRAVLALSALNAFALVAPLWLMVELWLTVSPLAIDGSIAIFRCFALAIGAIA
ncbi:MAG: hypothetical protein ACJAVR_001548 [Paracoccaceae bacterium]|jgi:hypothetical protein